VPKAPYAYDSIRALARHRCQSLVQASGWDMAATQTDQVSLPALAILTKSTLSHLGQEGASGGIIQSAGFWQAVGMLVGA
jgi:hypothetical protein